jgi:hypothetical protein
MRNTWRLILVFTFGSLLVTAVGFAAMRVLTQSRVVSLAADDPTNAPTAQPASPSAGPTADPTSDSVSDGEPRYGGPANRDAEPPELRESADNTISFPVDI